MIWAGFIFFPSAAAEFELPSRHSCNARLLFASRGSSRIEEACDIYARAANMFKMAKNWSGTYVRTHAAASCFPGLGVQSPRLLRGGLNPAGSESRRRLDAAALF